MSNSAAFGAGAPNSALPGTAPKDVEQWRRPLNTRDPAAAIPAAQLVPPFWQLKPPGGVDIQANARGQLPAGVGATLLLQGLRPFRIIESYGGVLAGLTVGILLPLATLDVTVTLLANGAPVQGWDNIQPPNVGANAVFQSFTGPLQLGQNTVLGVLFTNNAASGPWDVNVSLVGWMWPLNLEIKTFGGASV